MDEELMELLKHHHHHYTRSPSPPTPLASLAFLRSPYPVVSSQVMATPPLLPHTSQHLLV